MYIGNSVLPVVNQDSNHGVEWIAVAFDTGSDADGELRKKKSRKSGPGFGQIKGLFGIGSLGGSRMSRVIEEKHTRQ